MGSSDRTLLLDRLAIAPAIALVWFVLLGPVQSGDLWWHIRVGDWVREHRAMPWQDPFSHTAGNALYVPQEYGSQVLFSLVHSAFGLWGLKVLGALLAAGLAWLFVRLAARRVGPHWGYGLGALFLAAYALKWELRPHLISTLALLWIFDRLFPPGDAERASAAPSPALALGLAGWTAVWVQLHAEAVFLPIFCAAGTLATLLGGLWDRVLWGRPFAAQALWRWGLAALLTLAASFLSPLGAWPHRYALFKREIPKLYIDEWFPAWILPSDPRFAPLDGRLAALFALLLLLSLAVLLRGAYLRGRGLGGPSWPRLALLGLFLYLAVTARRYLWMALLPMVDLLLTLRGPIGRKVAGSRNLPRIAALVAALCLGLSHFAHNSFAALWQGRYFEGADGALLPVRAADFAAEFAPQGNLFHPYDWGGYLLYRLGPTRPIFVDGRTTLFEAVIPERWHAERDPAIGERVFAERDVRTIVARRLILGTYPPVAYRPPNADRAWIRVHADPIAEVWLRSDQTAALERIASGYRQHGIEFDPAMGFVELAAWIESNDPIGGRELFPARVARELAPAVERLRSDPRDVDGWLGLARDCHGLRLGRNARYALERYFGARAARETAFDPAPWRAQLERDGPAGVLAALSAN